MIAPKVSANTLVRRRHKDLLIHPVIAFRLTVVVAFAWVEAVGRPHRAANSTELTRTANQYACTNPRSLLSTVGSNQRMGVTLISCENFVSVF